MDALAAGAGRERGDHLVGIHVRGGAGPGLVDIHREMRVMRAAGDITRRQRNGARQFWCQQAQRGIDLRGCRLDQAQRADEVARHRPPGDREVLHRALGLRAPQRVGGHRNSPMLSCSMRVPSSPRSRLLQWCAQHTPPDAAPRRCRIGMSFQRARSPMSDALTALSPARRPLRRQGRCVAPDLFRIRPDPRAGEGGGRIQGDRATTNHDVKAVEYWIKSTPRPELPNWPASSCTSPAPARTSTTPATP
jgi:hypothetical protein